MLWFLLISKTFSKQIYKPSQQKPSHIMFLIKKRWSVVIFSTQNFSRQSLSLLKSYLRYKQQSSFRKYELLALIAQWIAFHTSNVIFRITDLIEPRLGSWLLIILQEITVHSSTTDFLDSYFFKLTLGSFPDQSLSNLSFRHNLVHMCF